MLGWKGEPGVELRVRTVRAVTDVELVYLSREDVHTLADQYAELRARLLRFERSGRAVDGKLLREIDLTPTELTQLSSDFKGKLTETNKARRANNLEDDAYVPRNFMSADAATVIKAAMRLKKKAASARARVQAHEAVRATTEIFVDLRASAWCLAIH